MPLKSFVTFQKHHRSSHDLITLKSWFNKLSEAFYRETQSISKHEKKGNTNTNTKQARNQECAPRVSTRQETQRENNRYGKRRKHRLQNKQRKEDQCPRP